MSDSNVPQIERNGLLKSLTKMVFGKRAKNNAGKEFYGPVLAEPQLKEFEVLDHTYTNDKGETETVKVLFSKAFVVSGSVVKALVNVDDLVWSGIGDLITMANKQLRQIFAGIYTDNIKADGTLDVANWTADATDFSGGVDRLSDIEDELDDIQTEQGQLLDDPALELNDVGVPVTEAAVTLVKKMKENKTKINALKQRKVEITAKYAERAEKRKANKEAAEAAAAKEKAAAA